jgi:AcrR family transcriptional regulator
MGPKIDAPSILEQRALRQRQLIDAALSLALESGAGSITVSAVATRAGMSRSSFYEYFSSSADLIADLVMDELCSYRERLLLAVSGAEKSLEYVERWIAESLAYVADGRHLLVKSLNSISFPDYRKAEIAQGHRALMSTIIEPLQSLGISDIHAALAYVQNTLDTASVRIESGNDAELEIQLAQKFAVAGLKALADLSLSHDNL